MITCGTFQFQGHDPKYRPAAGGQWSTRLYLPQRPLATRAFLLEHPDAIKNVSIRINNCTIVEARDAGANLKRQGNMLVLPITTYWHPERRWREFGALLAPWRDGIVDCHIDFAGPVDADELRVYALAFARARRNAEVLDPLEVL